MCTKLYSNLCIYHIPRGYSSGQWCLKDNERNISPTARLRVLNGRNFDSNLLACVYSPIYKVQNLLDSYLISKLIGFISHLPKLYSV